MSTEMTIVVSLISSFATALLGTLGWWLLEIRRNKNIRKSINLFLVEVLKPVIVSLKDTQENNRKSLIDEMKDFVDLEKGDSYLKTSYFPLFNSKFFTSFQEIQLRLAYKSSEKYVALLEVKGYLDGFQGRMPHDVQQDWIKFIEEHKKICKTDILSCESVKYQTRMFQDNLDSSREMAERMLNEINKAIS
jgi:hypothetical protein